MEFKTKKDIRDTTPHAKFGRRGMMLRSLRREGIFRYFLLFVFYLFCKLILAWSEDRSRPFMAQNAYFRV